MYTGNYQRDTQNLTPPQNYDGNAFKKAPDEVQPPPIIPAHSEPKISRGEPPTITPPTEEECVAPDKKSRTLPFSSLSDLMPVKGLLLRAKELLHLDGFRFGSEEILLCAVAAFLLFSKEGDKECAIALLILLFIN